MIKFFKFTPPWRGKKNRGFTLVETLVAVSIFSLSILALLSILSQGISNTNYAKQKMVAAFLNQEGIEYIRNLRDTYVLYSSSPQAGWNAFNARLVADACTTTGCYFNDGSLDYTNHLQPIINIIVAPCPSGSCPPLLYDNATGKYGYNSGSTSGFVRKINAVQINADQVKISSTTYYTQGSGTYNIAFSENLFNWVQ